MEQKELFYLGSFSEAFAEKESGSITKEAELFSVGTHRGVEYDVNDLETLAANFNAAEGVPLQYDHSDSAKDTVGFLRDARVEEGKLLGTVEILEESAIKRVQRGLNNKLSISFYLHETEEGIKPFKLREVSLVAFPQVKSARLFSEEGSSIVTTYEPKDYTNHEEGDDKMDLQKLREELKAELTEQYSQELNELESLRTQVASFNEAQVTAKVEKFAESKKIIPAQKDSLGKLLKSFNEEQMEAFEEFMKSQAELDLDEKGEVFNEEGEEQKNQVTEEEEKFNEYYDAQVKRFGKSI